MPTLHARAYGRGVTAARAARVRATQILKALKEALGGEVPSERPEAESNGARRKVSSTGDEDEEKLEKLRNSYRGA